MAGAEQAIIWSPEARADLLQIWSYYDEVAGRSTADQIVGKVVDACRLLEAHPFGGRSRDEVRHGLRSIAINPHVVFYRVTAKGVAEVVRVVDGRRDLDELFA